LSKIGLIENYGNLGTVLYAADFNWINIWTVVVNHFLNSQHSTLTSTLMYKICPICNTILIKILVLPSTGKFWQQTSNFNASARGTCNLSCTYESHKLVLTGYSLRFII
jgi:hypothetical protein